jgi:hypothetical protein
LGQLRDILLKVGLDSDGLEEVLEVQSSPVPADQQFQQFGVPLAGIPHVDMLVVLEVQFLGEHWLVFGLLLAEGQQRAVL